MVRLHWIKGLWSMEFVQMDPKSGGMLDCLVDTDLEATEVIEAKLGRHDVHYRSSILSLMSGSDVGYGRRMIRSAV